MSEAAAESTSPSKGLNFARRLASAVFLWGAVLWSFFSSHRAVADWTLLAIVLLSAGLGIKEFSELLTRRSIPHFRQLMIWGGMLVCTVVFLEASGKFGSRLDVEALEIVLLGLFAFALCIRRLMDTSENASMVSMASTLFGFVYVAVLLNFVVKVYFYPGIPGAWYVLFFIVVTKFSDAGAYIVGSLIGRHKMIPRVSPGKTWEGFAGAIGVSTLTALLLRYFASAQLSGMTWFHAVVLGIVLSACAVVGDLVESLFKREAGVKDSGNLFPGIGGALDLLDSLLFNAPLIYLYVRFISTAN